MSQLLPALLVVDDEDTNRSLLARLFESKGFQVHTASSGAAALEHVRSSRTDLVLLDMNMPGLTGFDVLKALRRTHTPGALPVVMVTGVGESHDLVEALELGANDYVTKPIDFPVVLARIKTQLARQQAENLEAFFFSLFPSPFN
jgi:DNA-binding response OmpR family regulator